MTYDVEQRDCRVLMRLGRVMLVWSLRGNAKVRIRTPERELYMRRAVNSAALGLGADVMRMCNGFMRDGMFR